MQIIRSLIVDDEKFSRVSLKKLLKPYPQIEIVDEAVDGVEAIEKIETRKPDLVFLDIQMPGLNGFEVLRALTSTPKPQVVFVTAFDQYAVKAFEVNAIDYLLKPIDEARLKLTMGKIDEKRKVAAEEYEKIRQFILHMERPKNSLPHIPLRRGRKIVLMNPADIHYLRSEQGVTIVVTQSGEYWASYPLAEMEGILDAQMFFRTHRSTIINLNRIKEIVPAQSGVYDVYLNDSTHTCVPLSRDRARVLRERYHF
ncbi:MAG: LytTR family DNA-binding domain-containing protein [Acidobacteria bacterium]|nr:LytTR family DNA-binding domain-containing protein [Acidobacteriota bacterium]MCI0720443.1 LytTR family DNA-binding domain-containing protein [Acidobacteriota bacterium]